MKAIFRQWLKRFGRGSKAKKNRPREKARHLFEHLESREMLSGSNAIDRLDFGNLASEASHNFEPGYNISQMPLMGAGAVGASVGQTYREPFGSGETSPSGSQALTFTLAVDPNRQNYLSVRLWGNDVPGGQMYLLNAPTTYEAVEQSGGEPAFPNRFFYYTIPIPLSWTQGQTSTQLTLWFASYYDRYGGTGTHYLAQGQLTRPIYSVYTHTDPYFVPDLADPTGAMPAQSATPTLDTLTNIEAISILQANRQSIFQSGGYLSTILARQAIVLNGNGTWSAPSGAPKEVAGLDMFTNLASWMSSNPSATNDTWRNRIANQKAGPGYTAFPDELLSAMTAAYLAQPFTNANGQVVSGLDDYHDSTLITRIVAAIDGAGYEQDSDGGFIQQGSEWTGLTSTARTTGSYIGSTARQSTLHGGGDLQGIDTYTLGWTIINLLNDSTAAPILQSYLSQSYDADLNGGSMLRAAAWERMLYNAVNWYSYGTGGTETQNMFQMVAMYSMDVALRKLQTLYPNSTYVVNPANYPSGNWLQSTYTPFQAAEMVMGLIPDTMRGVYKSGYTNYGMSQAGLGESGGVLDGGFDGGGYGHMLPWISPHLAEIAALDPSASPADVAAFQTKARATIDAIDHFIYPQENVTVNSSGVVTSDVPTMAAENFITYRNVENPNWNSGTLNVDPQYTASDPSEGVGSAYALRAAYLQTQYSQTPAIGAGAYSSLNYLKDLSAYESTIRSLINVNPSTLTPLPGEPGQGDYTWADVQIGAVAFDNRGERFFMNANWRNGSFNGGNFSQTGNVARIDDIADNTLRAAWIYMPDDSATVQSDGNYTGTYGQAWVVRYGDYLVVINQGSTAYNAKMPVGVGLVQDLVTRNLYSMSTSTALTTVSVAAGGYAIFWLDASSVYGPMGIGATGADVGTVGLTGSNSYADGDYTVSGAGADIGGTTDAFHFVSTSYTGDVSVSALISFQTASNSSAEAGVMIRDGSAANAAFAAVVRTPGNGLMFEWRSSTGGTMAWAAAPTPLTPVWVRITRSGGSLAGFYSIDGINWIEIGTPQSISLSSSALIGLAVSSHNTASLSTAVFNNVSIAAGSSPTIAAPAAASANPVTGTTVNLSVLGADAGGEANLTYTWYLLGNPPDPVTYSSNGANLAKNTTVTFATDGVYNFRVIIRDASGFIATSDVSLTVNQTFTSVSISPTTASLYNNGAYQFTAIARNQFGMPLTIQPSFTWSIYSGVGTVDSNGLFTAPASGSGSASVRATSGSLYGSATATVTATTAVGVFNNSLAIGSPSLAGSASYTSSTSAYTVSCGGSDIWGASDQFRYVYMPLTGDGTITARVVSENNTNTWAKAGVMFRNTLDASSAYAMFFVTPTTTNGVSFQYRSSAGGSAATNGTYTGVTAPYWIRLTRSGDSFKAERSADGVTWTQVGTSQTITMNDTIYVGLEVCSHATGSLMAAAFDNVSVTQPTKTFPDIQDIGSPTVASTYNESSGVITITSQNGDLWRASDQFFFANETLTSDATLITRVTSQTNTSVWTKSGLSFRKSSSASSAFIDLVATPSNGVSVQWRPSDGFDINTTSYYVKTSSSVVVPVWLKMVRSGNSFSCYYSTVTTTPTISDWILLRTQSVTMGASALGGIIHATNNSGSAPGTATFTNTSVTGATNTGPTVATAASSSANPIIGSTANLTVLGADSDGGESNLTYTWSTIGPIPGNLAFSANGTNAAKNTTVTFTKPGAYTFRVTITDTGGLSVTSSVSVTVNQTLTSIAVNPTTPSISPLGMQQFTAVAKDQFGKSMDSQPSFTWSVVSGSGSINSSTGLYTASAMGSSATVRATSGIYDSTTVSIVNQSPLLAASSYPNAANSVVGQGTVLSVLGVDDAGESNLIYSWSVIGMPPAPVTFGTNGNNLAKNTTATFTKAGTYNFQVTITDAGGLVTTILLNANISSTIVSRNIFYNNSKFDAAGDSAAIATDKTALLPGQTATFSNYTSYSLGINGIIVDIKGLANLGALAASDFQFQVGNSGTWTTAPAPISISAPGGGGVGGSDRVTITWNDNVIQNQWLRVTVLADTNTGLAAPDVFYFGNAIGDSGNSMADAVVDSADETVSRTHKTGFSAAAIDNHYDYNRDGRVNATDDLIARNNRTDGAGGNPLQLISASVGAPLSAGDSLHPLLAVADTAVTQPSTSSVDIAASQPITLPVAVDVVALQPVALLEDKLISQPAALSVEIAASQAEMSPATTEIAMASPIFTPVQTPFAPVSLLAYPTPVSLLVCPAVLDFDSFPRPGVAGQFPGVLHSQDMAANSILFSKSRDAIASDQWVLTPEHGNQMFMLVRGNQISRPAAIQDRLHDAVFAHSIARFSLTQEDDLSDNSSAPDDIGTFFNNYLPLQSGKSFASQIDAVPTVARHKKDQSNIFNSIIPL